MRATSFAALFVAAAFQIAGRGEGVVVWATLVAVLLVYPHVQYWRTVRSADPIAVELRNLGVDALMLGAAVAVLGYPLWLVFSTAICALSNNVVVRGWRGVAATLIPLPAGAAIVEVMIGHRFAPETNLPAGLICAFGTVGYLTAVNMLGYDRNRKLRQTRQDLRQRESELVGLNQRMQEQLVEIDRLYEQMREQANCDALTGLYNRHYLDSTLERELARCKREDLPLAVLLIDLDRFKTINDTYGHQAGDRVLAHLGKLLGGVARGSDIACRYGGEEFLVALPGMAMPVALERAEILRRSFADSTVPLGDLALRATLSVGIAVYPGSGLTVSDLINAADRALYRAKHSGRNRVMAEVPADGEVAPVPG